MTKYDLAWESVGVSVACPLAFSVLVPSVVVPSLKVIVPVGVLPPAGAFETVAVKVTALPTREGFWPETSDVEVANSTVCDRIGDVLIAWALSPPYSAVIEREPADENEALKVAFPPANGAVPNIAAPFLNVTVPVGAGKLEDDPTVAVKVTDCPTKLGFDDEVTVVVVGSKAMVNTFAPKDDCRSGLVTVTLFDPSGVPTVETFTVSEVGLLNVVLFTATPLFTDASRRLAKPGPPTSGPGSKNPSPPPDEPEMVTLTDDWPGGTSAGFALMIGGGGGAFNLVTCTDHLPWALANSWKVHMVMSSSGSTTVCE